jgi:hypothetical protein
MSIFDEAYDRHTGTLGEGGAHEIPRHSRWIEVPPGVPAPGVFLRDGVEIGFWLFLESHSLRQEQAILQRAQEKRGGMNIARGSAMIRDAIQGISDSLEDEREDDDEARTSRMRPLKRAEREWLWNALSQRGRNLIANEYDKLTEPATADEQGNG